MRASRNLIATLLALMPMTAFSTPTIETTACVDTGNECVTGIRNLELMGKIFDVNFVTGSFKSVYSSEPPSFLNDMAGSALARDAILAAFGNSIYGVIGEGEGSGLSRFFVPFRSNDRVHFGATGASNPGTTVWESSFYAAENDIEFTKFEPRTYTAFAVFSISE